MSYSFGDRNTRNYLLRGQYPQEKTDRQRKYKYLGMDLDNTLHDFKGASRAAMKAIYAYLSKKTKVDSSELSETYKKILKKAESEGFTKDISREEYRKIRFTKLLKESNISLEYIDELLEIYESNFIENLEAYTEMTDFLKKAHEELGLEVVIISEGPMDAQEITLEELGIKNFVDKLFTASVAGTSKTENLFSFVLQELKCQPEEVFYIGDSKERDIAPAEKVGIRAALFNPKKQFAPQVKSFLKPLTFA